MTLCATFGTVAVATASGEPFSFRYGDREYSGFEGTIDGTLKVSVERRDFTNYPGASWYTVWFENVGRKPSAVLSDIISIDEMFVGGKPLLRGILGDHGQQYRPYEHDFAKIGPKTFLSLDGRATHHVFPYFNLVHGDGGTLIALGWAGFWEGEFTPTADGVRVIGRNSVGFHAQLLPGEKVRSALVARIPYHGRSDAGAMNLWRRWYFEYVLPRNADGSRLNPITVAGFAADTGLPNSDGSISERSFTWQTTLKKLIDEKVVPDFRWFDAGWYCDPSGKTVPTDWGGTVGTWELDREKWPGDSFRESNEACHKAGMKVFMWFEPERVSHVDELVKNYGYKKEWTVPSGIHTSDLGNPDCFKWTLARILRTMDEGAVDMYREDNNSDPADAWKVFDRRTAEATGLVRSGISENKGIQGHYALWDGIIAHCKATGRCPYVDSCASGGGRNDLESMRRGFPMMRSDADRTTTALRLSMSWGFNKWIPFHGTATKETASELKSADQFGDEYVTRASLLPIYGYHEPFTKNKKLDFDILRRNLAEWRSVAELLTKDFYTLTPWHAPNDRTGWTAFAYHDPARGKGVLMAFRQEDCKEPTCEVTLPFVTDPAKRVMKLTLDKPRSSLLIFLSEECAGHARRTVPEDATDDYFINKDNYTFFCNSNETLLNGKPRGIVMEFPGLDGGSCLGGCQDFGAYTNTWSKFPEATAAAGLIHVYLMPGPWSWMNPGAVRMADLVVDAVRAKFGLTEGSTLVAAGGSMGGLGALVFAAKSRHRVTACAAACPCFDVLALYHCKDSFARTYVSAIAALTDRPLVEGLKGISPLHLLPEMPRIPYFVVCDCEDEIFPADGMDDYVDRLRKCASKVEYVKLAGKRHGEITPECRALFHAFVCR